MESSEEEFTKKHSVPSNGCQYPLMSTDRQLILLPSVSEHDVIALKLHSNGTNTVQGRHSVLMHIVYSSLFSTTEHLYRAVNINNLAHAQDLNEMPLAFPLPNLDRSMPVRIQSRSKYPCNSKTEPLPVEVLFPRDPAVFDVQMKTEKVPVHKFSKCTFLQLTPMDDYKAMPKSGSVVDGPHAGEQKESPSEIPTSPQSLLGTLLVAACFGFPVVLSCVALLLLWPRNLSRLRKGSSVNQSIGLVDKNRIFWKPLFRYSYR